MADGDDEDGYGLLMPFVVCASNGGPYDDASFVAGARFAQHQFELAAASARVIEWADYVEPEMVPQYDLLAMDRGFVMTTEPWDEHPDDWVLVRFRRPSGVPDVE